MMPALMGLALNLWPQSIYRDCLVAGSAMADRDGRRIGNIAPKYCHAGHRPNDMPSVEQAIFSRQTLRGRLNRCRA